MHRTNTLIAGPLLLTAALSLLASPAFCQVPTTIHQEGLLLEDDQPIEGRVNLDFAVYAQAEGGAVLWEEAHPNLSLFEGYYSVLLGSTSPLAPIVFAGPRWLEVRVNGRALTPRVEFASVPFAFLAAAVNGPVAATEVRVGGGVVIDANGRWIGDPTGLTGPPGPAGPAGPAGPQGPAGAAGGDGSPDTGAQILAKLQPVDGANSGLDADQLDGLHAARFMRTDTNTGTSGQLSAGNGLVVRSGNGAEVARVVPSGGHVDQAHQLRLQPQDGANEGGHLHVAGAANNQDWAIDNYQGSLRIYEPTPSRTQNRNRGQVQIAGNAQVTGNLTVGGIDLNSLSINGRQVIDASGRINQAQWDLYSQVRVLTNTVGNPDRHMYVNYPNRNDSQTFLYNDPRIVGSLTVDNDVFLGGQYIHDVGTTFTCESGGGALGNCPNSGHWTFDKIVLEHNHADVQARMNNLPTGSLEAEGIIRADGDIRAGADIVSSQDLRVGRNLYFGGSTMYDVGTTYTCESGGGPLGNCPNSGHWTFDKIVLEHNHADVQARMNAIPNGSINVEGVIRADGEIRSNGNLVAGGYLQAGASQLRSGELRLGNAGNQRLTAAQLSTLVGGGNADALHTHAAAARPWVNVGNLNNFFNVINQYPREQYEYGVTYNTYTILPVVANYWNRGWRIMGQYDYLVGDYMPWEAGFGFNKGGAFWLYDTYSGTDDGCTNIGQWRQEYYVRYGGRNPWNSLGDLYMAGSNGCSIPTLWVRQL